MTYSFFKDELICPFTCKPYIAALLFYMEIVQVRNCGRLEVTGIWETSEVKGIPRDVVKINRLVKIVQNSRLI